MKKIKQSSLFIFLVLLSASVTAQTDTGGGMGGTGIKGSQKLLDAAGLQQRTDCPLESAIGIVEIKSISQEKTITKKPICANETVSTKIDETAVIYFRNGLIIELKPLSNIVITNN